MTSVLYAEDIVSCPLNNERVLHETLGAFLIEHMYPTNAWHQCSDCEHTLWQIILMVSVCRDVFIMKVEF